MKVKKGTRSIRRPQMKRIKRINWRALIIALLVTVVSWLAWQYLSTKTNQAHLQRILELKQVEINKQLDELKKQKSTTQELEQQKQQLEKEKKDLNDQLQAKRANQAIAYAEPLPVTKPALSSNCGDNQYKQYIYQKESGCSTTSVNSIGCRGLGQACPGTKMPCGDDFGCQDAYFSDYAISRYGSWQNAYNWWVSHHWW